MGLFLTFFAIGFYISSDVVAYFQLTEELKTIPKVLIYTRMAIAVIAILGTFLMMAGVR